MDLNGGGPGLPQRRPALDTEWAHTAAAPIDRAAYGPVPGAIFPAPFVAPQTSFFGSGANDDRRRRHARMRYRAFLAGNQTRLQRIRPSDGVSERRRSKLTPMTVSHRGNGVRGPSIQQQLPRLQGVPQNF
jgi:hypothetical protein